MLVIDAQFQITQAAKTMTMANEIIHFDIMKREIYFETVKKMIKFVKNGLIWKKNE